MKIDEKNLQTVITPERIKEFREYLYNEEKSQNTITKYIRDIQAFYFYAEGRNIDKKILVAWKEKLVQSYAPTSVNSMLAAVNHYLNWQGMQRYRMKPVKIQREIFTKAEKELTKNDYIRLVNTANRRNNYRLSLLLQTICATGIRVSEINNITREAVHIGRAVVECKGKTRIIFLPKNLCRILCRFCRDQSITKGVVFRTRSGNPLNRSNIWRDMKALCKEAGVGWKKVYPHNLRHLFAKSYYQVHKDLSRLADLLGHTNISTTRLYTMESGIEHMRQIEKLGLVVSDMLITT